MPEGDSPASLAAVQAFMSRDGPDHPQIPQALGELLRQVPPAPLQQVSALCDQSMLGLPTHGCQGVIATGQPCQRAATEGHLCVEHMGQSLPGRVNAWSQSAPPAGATLTCCTCVASIAPGDPLVSCGTCSRSFHVSCAFPQESPPNATGRPCQCHACIVERPGWFPVLLAYLRLPPDTQPHVLTIAPQLLRGDTSSTLDELVNAANSLALVVGTPTAGGFPMPGASLRPSQSSQPATTVTNSAACATVSQPPGSLPGTSMWLPVGSGMPISNGPHNFNPLPGVHRPAALGRQPHEGSTHPLQSALPRQAFAPTASMSAAQSASGPTQQRRSESISAGLAALRLMPGRGINLGALPAQIAPQLPAAGLALAAPSGPSGSSLQSQFTFQPQCSLPIREPSTPAFSHQVSLMSERATLQRQMAAIQQQLDAIGTSSPQNAQTYPNLVTQHAQSNMRPQGIPVTFVPCPSSRHSSEDPAGFPLADPGHPDHIAAASGEDYSGQRPGKWYQERRRLAGISPVQSHGMQPLYWPGSVLSTQGDREQRASLPVQQAYIQYLSGRLASWVARLQAPQGVYSPAHPDSPWHQQKARFIIVRYQYLAAIILHLQGVFADSWDVTWRVLVMINQDFEARDFQQGLPQDTQLLAAFDLQQAATPFGNQLIASLTPSLVPQHYLFMARDSAAQFLAAAKPTQGQAKHTQPSASASSKGAQKRCGACNQTGHTFHNCTNPVVNKCYKCGHLHKVSGKNATPCPDPPVQGREAAAGAGAGGR